MGCTIGRLPMQAFRRVVGTLVVTAVLALSACSGTGRFSATAICERSGGDYVGHTCAHHSTPAEIAAQQWCETHGGVYVAGDGCELGSGGP
jgi:hypothetical protein